MSTSKRGSYHHGDLRDALVALALETIEQEGPEAVALRNLAQRAGVSGMAPYRHFADKTALMEEVARRGFAELHAQLSAVDGGDAKAALLAFGVVYVRFACARPGLFKVMFGGPPPTPDEEIAHEDGTVYALFSQRIAELVPRPRRQIAFLACWSLVHGFATLLVSGRIRQPMLPPEDLTLALEKMLLEGLLA